LRETWANTTTPVGKLMVTIIGGIAEFERELIRARTGDGIRHAKAAGVHMGRPPKLTKHHQREIWRAWRAARRRWSRSREPTTSAT
jgi:DNA invertase Pin-like site-specific DNA recombinase